jgi:hypothetical protein
LFKKKGPRSDNYNNTGLRSRDFADFCVNLDEQQQKEVKKLNKKTLEQGFFAMAYTYSIDTPHGRNRKKM